MLFVGFHGAIDPRSGLDNSFPGVLGQFDLFALDHDLLERVHGERISVDPNSHIFPYDDFSAEIVSW